MIKKRNKQLFDPRFLGLGILVFPLVAIGMMASFFPFSFILSFFVYSTVLVISLSIIFYNRLGFRRAEILLQEQDYAEKANLLQADIERGWQEIASLRKKHVDYSHLKVFAEKLNQTFSLEETSRVLSRKAGEMFGHKETTVILYLFHSRTGELGISSSEKGQLKINIKAKKGDIFDHWVVKNMQPLLIEDVRSDYRFDQEKIQKENDRYVRSLMSVPLIIGNKAIGILRLDSGQPNYFHAEHMRLLQAIGDMGAVAIENAQLYHRIEQLAIRDSLTGLFLRRHFLERLSYELIRELRKKKYVSFLMIDLDHFKKYNDTYGHMAGDIVLRTVGMILAETFNAPGDIVCRYGGEEFAVLLPERSKEEAKNLAEKLRKRISKQAILLRRQKTHITVSIGVASFPDDAQVKDELIARADEALYSAKSQGRNRVCVF